MNHQLRLWGMVAMLLCAGAVDAQTAALSTACGPRLQHQRLGLVVPHAAGGGFDAYARALAPVLESLTGARVTVSNIPNGILAQQAVAEGGSAPRIGLFQTSQLIPVGRPGTPDPAERFAFLGTVTSEFQAWAGRPDFSLAAFGAKAPLVAASSDPMADIVDIGFVAHLLDIPFRTNAGYAGAPDRYAAVLRGEADVASNSVTSTLKAVAGGDLKPVLLVANGPMAELPGVPWLAGPGSWAEQRARGLEPAARERVLQLAAAVVDLSRQHRVLAVSARTEPALLSCLEAAVTAALFHPEFARASRAVGRSVAPLDAAATRVEVARIVAGARVHAELIGRLLNEARR